MGAGRLAGWHTRGGSPAASVPTTSATQPSAGLPARLHSALHLTPDTCRSLPHTCAPPSPGARDLTAAEAAAARQACLNAFDDRQAARLHLLRARLAEGGAELSRLRALLADELHHLADPDRVAAEEAAAAFRLRMVQRRVEEHAPGAAAKRRELEARLDGDKRLAVALAAEAEARR